MSSRLDQIINRIILITVMILYEMIFLLIIIIT